MKITIYELLGLVKDGKAPKKIKYENREYYLYDNKSYLTTDKTRFFDRVYFSDLNVEVEILEEEKKIPEKIKVKKYDKCIHDVTHKEKEFSLDIRELQIRYNDLLDYLKSKGDE